MHSQNREAMSAQEGRDDVELFHRVAIERERELFVNLGEGSGRDGICVWHGI